MTKKLLLGDKEYDSSLLSDGGEQSIPQFEFVQARILELTNQRALLERAKMSYIQSLKREMLSNKAGFFSEDN